MKFNKKQLEKLSTKRLLAILHKYRAEYYFIMNSYGPRCCELCHEYIGDDWQNDVAQYLAPVSKQIDIIKDVLKTRPHVPRK